MTTNQLPRARLGKGTLVFVLVLVFATAVGFGISRVSGRLSLALLGAMLLVAMMTVTWEVVVRSRRLTGLRAFEIVDDGRFRGARLLVYAGLVTSCFLTLRVHGLTISDATFSVALGWAVVEYVATTRDPFRVLPPGLWLGIVLFVAGGTMSTIANSQDELSSFGVILRVFYLVAAWLWLGGVS